MKTTFKFENIDQLVCFCVRRGIIFDSARTLTCSVETNTEDEYNAAMFDYDVACEEV